MKLLQVECLLLECFVPQRTLPLKRFSIRFFLPFPRWRRRWHVLYRGGHRVRPHGPGGRRGGDLATGQGPVLWRAGSGDTSATCRLRLCHGWSRQASMWVSCELSDPCVRHVPRGGDTESLSVTVDLSQTPVPFRRTILLGLIPNAFVYLFLFFFPTILYLRTTAHPPLPTTIPTILPLCMWCICCASLCVSVVLDVICFERLMGKCSGGIQRSISEYRYLEQDLREYFDNLQLI